MKPMKSKKMWAVVNTAGLPVGFGYSKGQAIADWCEGMCVSALGTNRVEKVLVTRREK